MFQQNKHNYNDVFVAATQSCFGCEFLMGLDIDAVKESKSSDYDLIWSIGFIEVVRRRFDLKAKVS